jgi:N-acetylglucosamine kinase-like BadF-type ATPase
VVEPTSTSPAPLSFVLGLDGGGSRTVAVVLDGHESQVGRAVSGPSNHQSVGIEAAQSAVEQAVRIALEAAGNPQLAAACWGMAGLDRPEDERILAGMAQAVLPGVPVDIVHDTRIALAAGTGGKVSGVVIISGTGSCIVGYLPDGRSARAGGWGHMLGDEGSGFDLAHRGLNAASRARDGRGPATTLVERLASAADVADLEALADRIYLENWSAPEIASLAPAVLAAAAEGDAVAGEIVDAAADELALATLTVFRQLQLEEQSLDVVLSGGIFQGSPRLVERLRQAITGFAPNAIATLPAHEPAWGAARLALDAATSS